MSPGNLPQPVPGPTSAAPPPAGSGNIAVGATSPDHAASSLSSLCMTWELIHIQQLGFGSVAWLVIGPAAYGLAPWEAGRALRIGETGKVPEVEIENRGGAAVLVPAHLVVTGGWQTRAVERSVVLGACATARIPVKCVEAGRWAPLDDKTARTFRVAPRASMRTRWSTSQSMYEQLGRYGRFTAEQADVWQHVEEELSRTASTSHTRSYEAYLHGVKKQYVQAAVNAGVAPPAEANAMVLFPSGGGFWVEAYATPAQLAEHANDLLADLFDPGRVSTANVASGSVPPPPLGGEIALCDRSSIAALLGALWSLAANEVACVDGTIGSAFSLAGRLPDGPGAFSAAAVSGALLTVGDALAHLTLGGPPARSADASRAQADGITGAVAPFRAPVARSGEVARYPIAAAPESALHNRIDSGGDVAPGVVLDFRPQSPAGRSGVSPVVPPAIAENTHGAPKIGRDAMRAIFARTRDLLPIEPPTPSQIEGYRLMRVLDGNVCWVDIRKSGDGYAVLGSHDRCDLVLANDPGIWLRHLLGICVRLDDGTLGVRLIDLKTDVPFFLEDDSPAWSVTATGPFALRLGRHVICGFPIGPALDNDAPAAARTGMVDALPSSQVAPASTAIAAVSDLDAMRARALADRWFTMVPGTPVSQIQDMIGPSASPNHARVTLERGGMGASVEIPLDALDAGVLLGRALNCYDGGLRRVFCDAISRAHVLLLREHEEVLALDLCTTNGTRVAGRRIRRHRLSNDGATLELGKKVTFRWHRRRPSDASPPPPLADSSSPSSDASRAGEPASSSHVRPVEPR